MFGLIMAQVPVGCYWHNLQVRRRWPAHLPGEGNICLSCESVTQVGVMNGLEISCENATFLVDLKPFRS